MKNFIKWFLATLLILVLWTFIRVASTTNGWFIEAIAEPGNTREFLEATIEKIKVTSNGNASMLLIEDGQIFAQFNSSRTGTVSMHSIFGVSSLGKWISAVGVMSLVEQGKLELDAPVSKYLSRWKLPDSQFNNSGVTVRRLLSHTAGLTDGLGHNGFPAGEMVQPLVEHLTNALDADDGVSGKVAVGIQPGTEFKYSGGGYNLLQLLIEEVSGTSFEEYMQQAVFTPLGMNNSGYQLPENNLAIYYDSDGKKRLYPNYTSLAATGLFTTAYDLYLFVTMHLPGSKGEPIGRGVLSENSLKEMRKVHASKMGLAIWGAGPTLFVDNNQNDFIIGHGGLSPSLNATARFNPATGNGFVMLETGNRALSTDMAMQWTLWEAGKPGMFILRNLIPPMITQLLIGYLVILISMILIAYLRRRKSRMNSPTN